MAQPLTADRLAGLEQWHFWFVGRDQLVRHLLNRFDAGGPVLDAGCGTGSFAARLGHDGHSVIALDQTLAGTSKPTLPVRGDAERLPLAGGSVGAVLARDVLEHVDDRAAIRECHRVLRPGGLVIALVPAWPALWSERDVQAGHRRRYTRATLRRVFAEAGFRVLELRGYQFALLPVAAASRVASRRRGPAQIRAEERPPRVVNRVLAGVNRAEASLARYAWARPPTGSTLAAVAVRP